MAKISRLYRWLGWLILGTGICAVATTSIFHEQVEAAVAYEQTLGTDAGLRESQLRSRIGSVQDQIAQLRSLQIVNQVQALALLTRLSSRYQLLPQVQFHQSGNLLGCHLTTKGDERAIWSFLTSLDLLHERSQGSVVLRAYDMSTSSDNTIGLSLDLSLLTRPSGGSP